MLERHEHAPRCVYRLADSLDSILAACEDLLGQPVEPVHNILRLELAAITHVLQARRYIEEIDVREPSLVDECILFLAGTAAFDLGHLRAAKSTQSQPAADQSISHDYLIARQVPLQVLAERAGALLDALETHVLYGDERDAPAATSAMHHENPNDIGVQLWEHAPSFGS